MSVETLARKPATVRAARSVQASAVVQPLFWGKARALLSHSENQRLQLILEGFPASWIDETKATFGLSSRLAEVLFNTSTSTLERRRKDDKPLGSVASERLDRIATVATQAAEVFEDDDKAARWMATPNAVLGNKTPIELCEMEIGAKQVRRVLNAMEWGGVA
ncbi:antitoxin Xre/MbcA/ParS toxin-binding domain-containing protein [Pseudomonas purpurea]|uniref:type II RES/Xre toxin-antitoxin system antitoxin n=1 Tax=Pseudomonas purpurea TaxID=3136737 RepID=UPI0032674FAD